MVTKVGLTYNPAARFAVESFDVEYRRDGADVFMARVYRPTGPGPFPTLLYVHGGVWTIGERTDSALVNASIASSGAVVVAVDFRLAPKHPYPAQVSDVNYPTRWLKARATEFGGDPRSLGGIGASSGGQTVLLSAMRPKDPRYSAVPFPAAPHQDATLSYLVLLWPVLDPHARYLYAKRAGIQRLVAFTEGYFRDERAMQEGNSQGVLDRREAAELPPIVIVQGTRDDNIPLEIPVRFTASYGAAGGPVSLELFPNMPHGFANQPGPETERACRVVKDFIARQLAPAAE